MTAPRQVLPGTTYLVTHRCAHRQFLLKPSRTTNEVFLYVLALAARRYGVKVHAYCVLSNHYHLIVTDPGARLPAFQQLLGALVARALNASWGRWEGFWARCSFSAVSLATPSDILDKAAYVLANPVAARLVRSARQWPGLWSSPEVIGGAELKVHRPKHFFDPDGQLEDSLGLELSTPPGFKSEGEFRELLVTALTKRESEAAQAASGFLGVSRVLAQRPTDQPKSREPRRSVSPRIAARDRWKRIEAINRLQAFVVAYRRALAAWRKGKAEALFPAGTYLMRIAYGAACAVCS